MRLRRSAVTTLPRFRMWNGPNCPFHRLVNQPHQVTEVGADGEGRERAHAHGEEHALRLQVEAEKAAEELETRAGLIRAKYRREERDSETGQ